MDISQLLTHIYDDNIIKIYDTFESVDHCYIVMEILQGDLYKRGIEINDKNKLYNANFTRHLYSKKIWNYSSRFKIGKYRNNRQKSNKN